ncbi:MAG: FkbM family methyltransferase, partial [Proteobacteria bacterium]|nr:FkbM family methyltransferase [Pseudomonadota bacterium]MBU1584362.1 FkbM family methyltransferase [Pseudomonadota bacterium]
DRLVHNSSSNHLAKLSHRMKRNFLPNDDAAIQKTLMAIWRAESASVIGYKELLKSGFRVFSQNDEDGIILRIFSHIGYTNQYVIEIGSNCSDSDIGLPENMSTNLIANHGWHGAIFEIDQTECDKLRYFFARDFATKHFHMTKNGEHGYFSPLIVQHEISPENIDQALQNVNDEPEPDLMVIDIDGGEYSVMHSMSAVRPRVLVVEFEKRFKDTYSVVQFDSAAFSKKWPQSGTVSLSAWEKLLSRKDYSLCAIGSSGFNAFFVRSDIATDKFLPLTSGAAFDNHPILSKVPEDFWLSPDDSWEAV